MIRDGYGDEVEVEDSLAEWEQALTRIALRVLPREDHRFADVLQEGRITFWREYHRVNEIRWALARAKSQMRHLIWVGDVQWTGHAPMHGRIPVQTVAILDRPLSEDSDATLADLLLGANDALSGVEIAYHHGEIARALNELSPRQREYVVMRFWSGYNDSEIAAHQGLTRSGVSKNWRTSIRPHLVRELAHLGAS